MTNLKTLKSLTAFLLAIIPFTVFCQSPENLFFQENGVTIFAFSDEYGGNWSAANLIPSKEEMKINNQTIPDYVWCSVENAPFPHWVIFKFPKPQWITTLIFNNSIEEESGYPGISAKNVEIWVANDTINFTKIAAFQLEQNKNYQPLQIEPVQTNYLKVNITSNWGNAYYTELNAMEVFDDGSRTFDFGKQLKDKKKVDVYGIYFDFASATLRDESNSYLDKIVKYMKDNPKDTIIIEGHTDNVGTSQANLSLSEKRAKAVYDKLILLGVDAAHIEYRGYGFLQPIADNTSDGGRAKNRRVTIRLK
ncbi:MAG: OmpA family protein [Bacteroidota bacterium]